MSASIHWRPLETENARIDVWAPSSFLSSMKRAFGYEAPWRLGESDIAVLRGMAATHDNGEKNNPYLEMIRKIENDGEPRRIEVWPEY